MPGSFRFHRLLWATLFMMHVSGSMSWTWAQQKIEKKDKNFPLLRIVEKERDKALETGGFSEDDRLRPDISATRGLNHIVDPAKVTDDVLGMTHVNSPNVGGVELDKLLEDTLDMTRFDAEHLLGQTGTDQLVESTLSQISHAGFLKTAGTDSDTLVDQILTSAGISASQGVKDPLTTNTGAVILTDQALDNVNLNEESGISILDAQEIINYTNHATSDFNKSDGTRAQAPVVNAGGLIEGAIQGAAFTHPNLTAAFSASTGVEFSNTTGLKNFNPQVDVSGALPPNF